MAKLDTDIRCKPNCSYCHAELKKGKKYWFDGSYDVFCSIKCWRNDKKILESRLEKLPLEVGMLKHQIEVD